MLLVHGELDDVVPISRMYSAIASLKPLSKSLEFHTSKNLVHSIDEYCTFSRESYTKRGVNIPEEIKGDELNCYEVAAPYADLIIAVDSPSSNVSKKLMVSILFNIFFILSGKYAPK